MTRGIARILRNNILIGLVLVTPIAVTALIVWVLFQFFTDNVILEFIVRLVPESLRDSGTKRILAQVLAMLVVLMVLFLIGFFVRSLLGKQLYRFGDMLLGRIPGINKIYVWVRSISEAFVAQRQTIFKQVVLVEYPRRGLYSVAFVTAPVPPEFRPLLTDEDHEEFVSLFIPTTPNPTSGLMIVSPRDALIPLNLSIPDAMKLIVSAGAVYPGAGLEDERPTLIDKLENWLTREQKSEA